MHVKENDKFILDTNCKISDTHNNGIPYLFLACGVLISKFENASEICE